MNHHCKDWMKHPRQSFVKYMHSLHFFILIIFLERHNNIIDQLKEFDSSYTLRVDKPQNAQEGESESISLSSSRFCCTQKLFIHGALVCVILTLLMLMQYVIEDVLKLYCLHLHNTLSMMLLQGQDTYLCCHWKTLHHSVDVVL